MNASFAAPATFCAFHNQRRSTPSPSRDWRPSLHPAESSALRILSSLFRPNRRRRRRRHPDPHQTPKPSRPPDQNIEFSINADEIANTASAAVSRFYHSTESRLHRLLSAGADAYQDLRTSVHVDPGHRVVFSCRRSSLLFVEGLVVWSLVAFLAVRVLIWVGIREVLGFGGRLVVRRDRSLGGREVVVGRSKGREVEGRSVRGLVNPLSPPKGMELKIEEAASRKRAARREELPKWWPESVSSMGVLVERMEGQKEADRLVREIMDSRMSGEDFKENDIIQLRQICKLSGARVSFETENARNSFYRAALDVVLNSSCRVTQPGGTVLIEDEDARQFISGLAYNIGLENVHATRLVRAAVAARTRSLLLQSWALVVQGNRSEALEELSKICQIYHLFPPEEFSPEMEMVAAGLKKNLRLEQREHLLNLFKGVCDAESQRVAAEALGLIGSS